MGVSLNGGSGSTGNGGGLVLSSGASATVDSGDTTLSTPDSGSGGLTKEQFEALNQEFINFLATQSITADEWKEIKEQKPEVAEEELDIFSDLVWEGVLSTRSSQKKMHTKA